MYHFISFFLKFKSNLLVKRVFFLLNVAFATAILDLISRVHLPSFVNMLESYMYLKKYDIIYFRKPGLTETMYVFCIHMYHCKASNLFGPVKMYIFKYVYTGRRPGYWTGDRPFPSSRMTSQGHYYCCGYRHYITRSGHEPPLGSDTMTDSALQACTHYGT